MVCASARNRFCFYFAVSELCVSSVIRSYLQHIAKTTLFVKNKLVGSLWPFKTKLVSSQKVSRICFQPKAARKSPESGGGNFLFISFYSMYENEATQKIHSIARSHVETKYS